MPEHRQHKGKEASGRGWTPGRCNRTMLFLGRILLTIAVLAGLAYGALYALTTFVVPEQRDIVITIPMPKSPS